MKKKKTMMSKLLELAFYIACFAPAPAALLGLLAITQWDYTKKEGMVVAFITCPIFSAIVFIIWLWRQRSK